MVVNQNKPLAPNPQTGAQRGANLRLLLDRHGVSAEQFAEWVGAGVQTVHIWTNGGKTAFGRDVVTQTRPKLREKLLGALRRLEPRWTDEDLWQAFGIPQELRPVWRLPEGAQEAQEGASEARHEFRTVSGIISAEVPVRVTVLPGERGLQVWALLPSRTNGMILPEGEAQPHAELLGALAGFEPL